MPTSTPCRPEYVRCGPTIMSHRHSDDSWAAIVNDVIPHLTERDDPHFWGSAIAEVFRDAQYLCRHSRSKSPLFSQIGACSHWQRPHQHQWLKDGSFAAPYGYSGDGFNIHAFPEFDWSLCFCWTPQEERWTPAAKVAGKHPLILRVTAPTRTTIHDQAAVHTLWTPGSPTTPDQKAIRLYGFRKMDGQWRCTATAGHESPYEFTEVGD